jgi:SNF2 family DNA or RNA helicase
MPAPVLMPHQEEAVRFLEANSGCGLLAMEPGTGKTLSALEFVRRNDGLPVLVVALVTNIGMWKGEINRWYPHLSVGVIRGTRIQRMKVYNQKHDVYLIGYETFRNEVSLVPPLAVKTAIYDESGKIRTPTAKVSKVARMFQPPFRIALDGTPVSNTLADLWNISEWIRPKIFHGNWWSFRARHAVMNPYIPGKIDDWRDKEWITSRANERIFWKKKVEVLKDLPPMTQTDVVLEPTAEEKRVYKKIKEELRVEIEGEDMPITNALALMMRLRQAANGTFSRPDTPTKTTAIIDLIESLPPKEKVVIFSQFETVVEALSESLPYKTVKISGKMKIEDREKAISDFEKDPEVRAIIMTSAGEKGLNLQCASYMIQHDLTWSAGSDEQRTGRIWRHGQMQACTVWNLLMDGTVDMHMARILTRKKALAESVASQGESAGITMQDIQDILS